MYYSIYGIKDCEVKLVFRSITMGDFNRRGRKNAEQHGYSNFTAKTIPEIGNGWKSETVRL
ncbi:MAG: hypothetical protein RR806_07870 [Oscillospiraceae bacterium]